MGAPPGFGPPPGFEGAPGMAANSPVAGMQAQFQPPPNMPNINFNAPVIRLGVDGGNKPAGNPLDRLAGGGIDRAGRGSNAEPLGNRGRLGLGAERGGDRNLDRERQAVRESMMALQPPTREEVARTIFVGGLSEGTPDDDAIEMVLRCAGKLRRWTRARDADDKKCKFGFAEYEDVESLEAANEILVGVEVPTFNGGVPVKDADGEPVKTKLLVVVDDQSKTYIEEWKGRRREDDDARQFRMDGCKEDLRQCVASLANSSAFAANGNLHADRDGDLMMGNGANGDRVGDGAQMIALPPGVEDELSDIPADQRATVAEEIKAFRDRSNRRDIDRLRREEEAEQAERLRSLAGVRVNRLASPPPNGTPLGPAGGANGIPVGPRAAVPGAPSGPKGFRGAQMPSDYSNGVTFVVAGTNGSAVYREDEDAEESDEELERKRKAKHDLELEKQYLDAERRVLNRERTRGAAQERERVREEAEKRELAREKEQLANRFREWDDEEEARALREEYYYDRSSWLRKRGAYRDREQRDDDRDRMNEERERAVTETRSADARGMADDFLDSMATSLPSQPAAARQPAGGAFKMSLGSAAAKTRATTTTATTTTTTAPRRALADVEGLLEDEEDSLDTTSTRPTLKPLTDTSLLPHGQDLSDADRDAARRELISSIPTTASQLFAFPLQWRYLTASIIDREIRPFVEKKVVEYLGVQEEMLVESVVEGLRSKKKAEGIIEELEGPLEDEAEILVKKVWRMAVFWSEGGARGLV